MNVWRWLGISFFVIGALCLIGSSKLPVFAGGKDKDKDAKVADKDKSVKDKDAKTTDKNGKDKDAKVTDKDKSVKDKDAKVTDKDGKDKDAKVTDKDGKDKDAKDGDKDKKKEEVKKVDPPKGALEFKAFAKGANPFFQEQTTTTNQKMKVMGQSVEQNQEQTFIIQWTPKDSDKDGNLVVEQQIVGVKMSINIGGNKISYSSTDAKAQKNPMTDFFEQLTKQKLTFTVKPDLSQVIKIEGREDFVKGLSDINPQMQGLLKAILSDKALTKMAEPTWYAFPANGALEPKTWKKTSELDLGPIGKYNTTFDFTYTGQENGKDAIDIKTKLDYTAPTEKAGLPFVIHEAKLTTTEGKGKAVFDRAKGRFDTNEINMKLVGTLTIEVGNMRTVVELDQTQKAISTTRDDNPFEKKQ